jgi:hypothetical protein
LTVARKLTALGVAGIAAFYLVVSPTAAANAVKHTGILMQHAGHQVATFLKAIG